MIFVYSDLLSESLLLFLTFAGSVVTALVLGIAMHEFSHAFSAYLLGDDTAKLRGRVSLNPLRHLDPTGTVFLMIGGFGWGKPTPVNPYNMRVAPDTGRALTAAAGPLMNLLIASIAAAPIRTGLVDWRTPFLVPRSVSDWGFSEYAGLFLSAIIIFNIVLAVFNLLPIAPLDGFSVAVGILPRDLSQSLARLEQYGPGILLLLLVMPFLTGGRISLLYDIMSPFINFFTNLIAGGGRALG